MSQEIVYDISSGVKQKEMDGGLRLFTDRLEWSQKASFENDLLIKYDQIKLLKMSPETPEKLYLRIIMKDKSQYTFHFHTLDFARDVENRTKSKSLIAKLMAASKNNNDSESALNFEQKNRLLTAYPKLYHLYKEIVVAELASADDFWSSSIVLKDIPLTSAELTKKNKLQNKHGIPNGFWTLLAPVSKGCNEISLNLTTECINAIFLAYPLVKIKFEELVPEKLSEMEFWTQFFQAQYFYRDRSKTYKDKENMFLRIFHDADTKFKDEIISGFDSDKFNLQTPSVLPDGYGGIFDDDSNNEKLSLARQFNLQSRTILKTFQDVTLSIKTLSTNPYNPNPDLIDDSEIPDKTLIDFDSQKFSLISESHLGILNTKSKINNINQILSDINDWKTINYDNSHFLPCPQENITNKNKVLNLVESDLLDQLVSHYKIIYELLRIFWNSFPINQSLIPKLHKRMSNIEKYYTTKYLPWMTDINTKNTYPHIDQMIQTAKDKYASVCSKFIKNTTLTV